MSGIIRTQINRDGTISVWNTMKDNKKDNQYYVMDRPKRITESRLTRLNDLRDFNRLSEQEKFLLNFPEALSHVPHEKGNCLSITG